MRKGCTTLEREERTRWTRVRRSAGGVVWAGHAKTRDKGLRHRCASHTSLVVAVEVIGCRALDVCAPVIIVVRWCGWGALDTGSYIGEGEG